MDSFLSFLSENLTTVLSGLYLLTVIFIAILIVLENRSPLKTISWVLVLVLLPFAGIVFYLFFGQEYRKKKMFSRKGLKSLERLRKMTQDQLVRMPQVHNSFDPNIFRKKHLMSLMLSNSNALLTSNNEVQILKNGAQTFPAIFRAIEQAKHHIHIEFYIIDNDTLGNQLRELLIRKAREGVGVRLIYDDVGSWALPRKYINSLKEAGVKIDCFMKVRFPHLTSRANYRNHRKIVVVDGHTGFLGGLNVADRYLNGTKSLGIWRDTHMMVKGGAATMLQIIFMADWYFVSKEILQGENYFLPLKDGEGKLVQVVASGPDSDWESIGQAYFSAIASATERVYLTTPYLIPTPEILNALKVAAMGGVDVRILVPHKSDAITPKWSTRSFVSELLEAGVKIYFYEAGFLHSKLIVVDGVFSSVGSANFDFRSLETNFEVNAMIYDEEIARELEQQFLADLQQSRQIVSEEWEQRSRSEKAKESFARLLSPML
ncbi:cardiolipin synthase [Mangrovibacterium diazotrophicum]|uniref:Cardiolipin synthase n=1 Tax=Mangrovibacterium diazotrophicum TaxID=1261403 RepID=A0A419WB46_9BACT|nr:cardiolipin synthase [Mangrovibacterium diazotrophicum]RKD92688.1 cardiolipin synthetase 2 [Mangrovibacterium diazotrophicum]